MPSNFTTRQREKRQAEIQRDVLKHAAATHTRFGRQYIRAGRPDLAGDEAECARRALIRAREIA